MSSIPTRGHSSCNIPPNPYRHYGIPLGRYLDDLYFAYLSDNGVPFSERAPIILYNGTSKVRLYLRLSEGLYLVYESFRLSEAKDELIKWLEMVVNVINTYPKDASLIANDPASMPYAPKDLTSTDFTFIENKAGKVYFENLTGKPLCFHGVVIAKKYIEHLEQDLKNPDDDGGYVKNGRGVPVPIGKVTPNTHTQCGIPLGRYLDDLYFVYLDNDDSPISEMMHITRYDGVSKVKLYLEARKSIYITHKPLDLSEKNNYLFRWLEKIINVISTSDKSAIVAYPKSSYMSFIENKMGRIEFENFSSRGVIFLDHNEYPLTLKEDLAKEGKDCPYEKGENGVPVLIKREEEKEGKDISSYVDKIKRFVKIAIGDDNKFSACIERFGITLKFVCIDPNVLTPDYLLNRIVDLLSLCNNPNNYYLSFEKEKGVIEILDRKDNPIVEITGLDDGCELYQLPEKVKAVLMG